MSPLESLYSQLGYTFSSSKPLAHALTHCSAVGNPVDNNERLEFLGDAVLNFVIASTLYRQYPFAKEGELSRLRSSLVKEETLAEIARNLDLGHYLRLGTGELKSGGFRRDSILADALEAILGAIYLDGGFSSCEEVVLRLYQTRLQKLNTKLVSEELKDPKTRLQELLQSRHWALPEYQVLETHGEAHDQTFKVRCRLVEIDLITYGVGSSRRRAEQIAAEEALEKLYLFIAAHPSH